MTVDAEGGRCSAEDWLPALPFAAALWLVVAHLLPLRFAYHPNTLGIVSLATLQRYPTQQETAWYLLSLAGGGLLALGLATAFARRAARGRAPAQAAWRSAGAEAAGVVAIACVLALPTPAAALGVAACLGAAFALAAGAETPRAPLPDAPLAIPRARWIPLFLLAAALLTPPFWTAAIDVAAGAPDARLVKDNWPFHAELGQHLVWADTIARGGFQGRDFFSLYGPLFPASLAATWALLGRSLAAANLWDATMHVMGLAAVLYVASALVQRRALLLALPFVVLFANLRIAIPLAMLVPLLRWHARRGLVAPVVAGVVNGTALLFSQEFGTAALLATGLVFAVLGAGRAAAAWAAGVLGTMGLILAPFAWQDALAALLRDVASYPSWVAAGFGKLPFPSPLTGLPLDFARLYTAEGLVLRLGLGVAAVCAAAIVVVLPRAALAAARPAPAWRALRARLDANRSAFAALWLGAFGVVAFRAALGRSSLNSTSVLVPIAALLLLLAADRVLAAHRQRGLPLAQTGTRLAGLAFLAWAGAFTTIASPASLVASSLRDAWARPAGVEPTPAEVHVGRVTERIRALTGPDDAIYVLPNSGAYYYLAARRSPTRFVLAHQMVTNAHRAEALDALRGDPPRLVVWDDAGGRVDGIDDARVLGAPVRAWLDARYELAERVGRVRLLRPRAAATTPAP